MADQQRSATALQHCDRHVPRRLSDVRNARGTGDILTTAASPVLAQRQCPRRLLFNLDAASIICFSHKRQTSSCKTGSLSPHGSSAAAASSVLHLQRLDIHVGSRIVCNISDNVNAACIHRSSFNLSVQALRASTTSVLPQLQLQRRAASVLRASTAAESASASSAFSGSACALAPAIRNHLCCTHSGSIIVCAAAL